MNLIKKINLGVVFAAFAMLAACNQETADSNAFSDNDGLLKYVPTDTPYVFAALAPTPDDVREKIEPRMEELLQAYQVLLRAAIQEGMNESADDGEVDPETADRVEAVFNKLTSMLSVAELKAAGFGDDARAAIYGIGVLPVFRVTLEDSDAFEAKLAEIEAEAGEKMTVAEIDGQSYRVGGDEEVSIVIAIHDGHALFSLLPAGLSEDAMREVLGMKLPATSIAKSGRLQALADKYNYTPYGAGFVDFVSLADMFLTEQQGANAEVLGMLDFDAGQFSDVCKAEFREMAAVAPRLVSGYTSLNAEAFESNTVLELRRDIADGLATLTAPVPGLGKDPGGMVSMGASIDLLAAREFYSARLDALEEDPYECELLAQTEAVVMQGRAMLEQPVPPMVYGVKGFLANISNVAGLDVATKQPPTSIDAQFLLASDNAPGLVAMGSMFSPELAMLGLEPNGEAVRFESPMLQPPVDNVFVAMTDSAVALSVGDGGEAVLPGMLSAAPGAPQPFFSMHMDAGRYYSFIGEATQLQDDGEVSAEMSQAVSDLMQALSGLIDRISMNVLFTDRGVEFPTVTTLAD